MKIMKALFFLTLSMIMFMMLIINYGTWNPVYFTPAFIPPNNGMEPERKWINLGLKVINLGCRKDPQNKTKKICENFEYSEHTQLKTGFNEAVLGNGSRIPRISSQSENTGQEKIIWLTNFVDFRHANYRKKMSWKLDDNEFAEGQSIVDNALEARMFEVIDALQKNLEQQMIDTIHILVEEWESIDYLRTLDLTNSGKMVLQFVNGSVTMNKLFLYATKCLKDRIVAISNQDNMMGAGWDQLQPNLLRRNKILYAITRNPSFKSACFVSAGYSCSSGGGSYDTFIFHVKADITKERLKLMDTVTANTRGMEHVLIWVFRKELGYTVLNLCLTLIVHHQHCVPLRENKRRVYYPQVAGPDGLQWRAPSSKLIFNNTG